MLPVTLAGFTITRPPHEVPQEQTLVRLAEAHADAEAAIRRFDRIQRDEFAMRIRNVLARCAPGPDRIRSRGIVTDALMGYSVGTRDRTRRFDELVGAYFEDVYPASASPPRDLVHVTCTGYASPSGAQRLVAGRSWPTRVTHAYHMGCYASMPAVRLAGAMVQAGDDPDARVDIVHTELCSLHLDPADNRLEQLVVQSLFADGFIRYSASGGDVAGLRLLAADEVLVPGSTDAMTWVVGDHGMQMTLARDVPDRIAGCVRPFVDGLFARAGRPASAARDAVFAVHPGGPKIVDRVAEVLELDEAQVAASRGVLRDYGNMSSATLPHIWARVLDDAAVAPGTLVASLAFGPGLTVCGALFEKHG